jgi:hypothetical protein
MSIYLILCYWKSIMQLATVISFPNVS